MELPTPSLLAVPHGATDALTLRASALVGLPTPSSAAPRPSWGYQYHRLLRLMGLPTLSLPAAPHGAIDGLTLRASSLVGLPAPSPAVPCGAVDAPPHATTSTGMNLSTSVPAHRLSKSVRKSLRSSPLHPTSQKNCPQPFDECSPLRPQLLSRTASTVTATRPPSPPLTSIPSSSLCELTIPSRTSLHRIQPTSFPPFFIATQKALTRRSAPFLPNI